MNTERLTTKSRDAVTAAVRQALTNGNPNTEPVHLLHGLLLTPDNKVEVRMLTADRAHGFNWVVDKGISDGDRLIVEGVQKIRPGMEVKFAEVELGADGLVKQKAPAAAPAKAP